MKTYEVQWIPQDLTPTAGEHVTRDTTHRTIKAESFSVEDGNLSFWITQPCAPPPGAAVAGSNWTTKAMVAMFAAQCWDFVREVMPASVRVMSVGQNKIGAIKVVRGITGMALKEAKDLIEGPIPFDVGVKIGSLEQALVGFREVGATAVEAAQ